MRAEPTGGERSTNVTIPISADLLRRARIKALEQDSSLSAVIRDFLERYVKEGRQETSVVDRLRDVMDAGELHWGERTWSREGLYDR